jgi:hypothetical protein
MIAASAPSWSTRITLHVGLIEGEEQAAIPVAQFRPAGFER